MFLFHLYLFCNRKKKHVLSVLVLLEPDTIADEKQNLKAALSDFSKYKSVQVGPNSFSKLMSFRNISIDYLTEFTW